MSRNAVPSRSWLDDRAVPFQERVFAVVRLVPFGKVTTYGDVGAVMGNARYARQVGWALAGYRRDQHGEVPWHRVINGRGMISARGDFERASEQLDRLEDEGVLFDGGGRCRLDEVRFDFGLLMEF